MDCPGQSVILRYMLLHVAKPIYIKSLNIFAGLWTRVIAIITHNMCIGTFKASLIVSMHSDKNFISFIIIPANSVFSIFISSYSV